MLNRSKVHISVEVRIGLRRRGVAGPADLLPVGLVTDLPQVHQHRHHPAADNAISTGTFTCQLSVDHRNIASLLVTQSFLHFY